MTTENSKHSSDGKRQAIHEESILKVSKEIAIKFIEMGRITPATFDESFKNIYATIQESVAKE